MPTRLERTSLYRPVQGTGVAMRSAGAGPKAQSAMEYLVTYGWAILVIVVVAAAFYALGVFGSTSNNSPDACVSAPGFICRQPILNSTGNMSIIFGQIGQSITVTGTGCNKNSTPTITNVFQGKSFAEGQPGTLVFYCPITSNILGTTFAGNLWIAYSTSTQTGLYMKFASVSARVSTAANVVMASGTALSVAQPSVSPASLSQGQASNVVDTGASGGTAPYTYQWYVETPGSGSYAAATSTYCSNPSSTTCSFSTTSSTPTGTYGFELQATDSASGTATSAPASVSVNALQVEYVPITITNSQGSATAAPFQEMLNIPSSTYSSYITSQWTNVEFTTGPSATGSTLPAWVEGGNSNTASDTVVWVRLPGAVPANGNTVIYMDFMISNVMSASGPTGEAPALSASYGQYDNGAAVFGFYDNFAGPSLSDAWTSGINPGGSITVDNGLTLYYSSSSGGGASILSDGTSGVSYTPSSDVVWESQMSLYGSTGSDIRSRLYYWASTSQISDNNPYSVVYQTGNGDYGYMSTSSYSNQAPIDWYGTVESQVAPSSSGPTSYTFLSQQILTPGAFTFNTLGYPSYSGVADYIQGSPYSEAYYLGVSASSDGASGTATQINIGWTRVRAYPPNGAMPSASFGPAA